MSTEKYKLYRKMSADEFSTLVSSGLTKNNSFCCPKKCFSESIVSTYRLNPYYSAITQVIAEIILVDSFRDKLFKDGIELKKPIHSDKTYSNYAQYKDINMFYKCHGSLIPVFNHEIDNNYIDIFNRNIMGVNSLNLNNYNSIILERCLRVSRIDDLLTKKSLEDDEYYIQLPYDLAVIALRYNSIPSGGLGKCIKNRIICRDYDLIDEKNHNVFPMTLAIKMNKNAFKSKIKNCFDNGIYNIESDLIYTLNSFIENIRLVECKEDRFGYRRASSILNTAINISDVLESNFDDGFFTYKPDQIDFNTAIRMIDTSSQKDYFVSNITNVNGNVYPHSDYHGKTHAERVCLYSYLIACYIGLSNEEIKSIITASLLHDIGRTSDSDGTIHGKLGADKIEELAIFSSTQESKNIIKFLVEAHALERDSLKIHDLLIKYDIKNHSLCLKLLNILMDADALDRKRFTVFSDSNAKLEDSYLRMPISNKLKDLSELISKLYYDNSGIALKKIKT